MHEIGKNLKELRNEKGLSVRGLAEILGISHNTLASYERYDVVPTITNAVKICEYFKVPVEYLIYGKKVNSDFNDADLLRLFNKIDGYSNKDKELAKKYLNKLIKNVEEREGLEKEVE